MMSPVDPLEPKRSADVGNYFYCQSPRSKQRLCRALSVGEMWRVGKTIAAFAPLPFL